MKNASSTQELIAELFQDRADVLGLTHAAISQQLAQMGTKVSASSISKMLNNERGISLEMAMRLCEVLDVPWGDLFVRSTQRLGYEDSLEGAKRWIDVTEHDVDGFVASATMALVYIHRALALAGHPHEWARVDDEFVDSKLKSEVAEKNRLAQEVKLESIDLERWLSAKKHSTAYLKLVLDAQHNMKAAQAQLELLTESWGGNDGPR